MAYSIPRKAVGSGSQSPEPATAPIKRKPVDNINLSNKRVSEVSANSGTDTPQSAGFTIRSEESVELRFALGHGGLVAWYDPTCRGQPGNLTPYVIFDYLRRSWSAQGLIKKLQIGHDELKETLDSGVLNIQLLQTSPGGLTCLLHTDMGESQQQHCEMPFKSPMTFIGPGKQQYQKCEEAHGNLLPWITTCTVNGVPPEDIQISFGPDDAYYGYETVKRKVQSKLIIDLQDCLHSRPDELPAHMSMGAESAWSVFWADGTHEHHIMPNLYPTLASMMERPDFPRQKRVMLNPVKRDEFIVEFETGHYFIRARLQREDLSKLDAYLKRIHGKTTIIIVGVDTRPLKGNAVCKPFLLPASDFSSTPYGDFSREGHLAEWREPETLDEVTNSVMELGRAAGVFG